QPMQAGELDALALHDVAHLAPARRRDLVDVLSKSERRDFNALEPGFAHRTNAPSEVPLLEHFVADRVLESKGRNELSSLDGGQTGGGRTEEFPSVHGPDHCRDRVVGQPMLLPCKPLGNKVASPPCSTAGGSRLRASRTSSSLSGSSTTASRF